MGRLRGQDTRRSAGNTCGAEVIQRALREESAGLVERVDPDPHSPVLLPFRQVHVPDAAGGPADLLAGTNLVSRRHSW